MDYIKPKGPNVKYLCPRCGFSTDMTNCDDCNAIVKWDNYIGGKAHCTNCLREVYGITCRKCGYKFSVQ